MMVDKIQINLMVFCAFILGILAFIAPLALAPIFIIIAAYPGYLYVRQLILTPSSFGGIWHDSLHKVIILSLGYCLLSSIWAIKPSESLVLWLRMLLFYIGALGLFAYRIESIHKERILIFLLYGLLAALSFANIEIISNGIISKLIGLEYKVSHQFEMVIFNRGASILSLFSWPVICYLCHKERKKTALLYFVVTLATLARLESFSAVISFVISGIVILPLVYYKGKKILHIFAVLAVIGVFAVALAAQMMDAHKMVGNVPVVPGAASDYRLYIWDYAAKQAIKKPFLGWGFNASRSYPVLAGDMLPNGRHPLPLHPHNNVLQIWLELGLVGLVMFAALLYYSLRGIAKITGQMNMAICSAFLANYFIIGQIGYGIWQNWWLASFIIALVLLQLCIKVTSHKPSLKLP